jgi:PhoPQ-activated pathogenicity-related protein
MKLRTISSSLFLVFAISFTCLVAAGTTALDIYVAKPDPNYSYVHRATRNGAGYTVYVVTMTSQQWRSPTEVNRTLWEHEVRIAVPWIPHSGNRDTAILIVNGGSTKGELNAEHDAVLGLLAEVTGSVVAMVSQVPNQPLFFDDEAEPKEGEALLAYGMDKYLETEDPKWLVQFPMTKAVVKTMDTLQALARSSEGFWSTVPHVNDFVVVGASKWGWAAALTAAVEAHKGSDSRVKAILLASIDLLNLNAQFSHHWEAYGFYAPAVQDYVDLDLPCRLETPAGRAMLELIDPYEYRDRLTMPKLLLNSAGDQFFLPDSSQFYYADLPVPKRLRYTLNTDHYQAADLSSIIMPALSWLSDVLDGKQSPEYYWWLLPNGSIRVQTAAQPKRVRLWQATNPMARDFRLESIGAAWTSTELQETSNRVYIGHITPPAQGWTAFTVELTYPRSSLIPTPLESDQIYTTDVRIIPDALPQKGTACFCWACLPTRGGWRAILR